MSISIKNIVENWELLTNGNDYYEEELFTKFQDAFISETKSGPSGIKIIHHARSYVHCADFSKLKSTAKVKDPKSELADLRLLTYSLKSETARLLFLQFKRGGVDSKGHFAKIGEKQMLLFSEFPEVSFEKMTGACKILKDDINSVPQSGAMFAIIEYDKGSKEYNLRFMNHTQLNLPVAVGAAKSVEKHYYDDSLDPTVNTVGTSFEYYDYASSFKKFMQHVKDMKVGREIDFGYILTILSKEEIPEDLKEYFRKENILADDSNRNNNVTYHQVDTIALNVDELE